MSLPVLERIALALELRALRYELHNGMLRSETDKERTRDAIEARRRRLLEADIAAPPPQTTCAWHAAGRCLALVESQGVA